MKTNRTKNNNFTPLKKISLILLILCGFTNVKSQDKMLIEQIEGRTIVRESYSSKGLFTNKQIFKAGKIIQENGNYEIKVTTELFDKNKKSTEKYETTYSCNPDKFSIIVFVFPFANPNSKDTEISFNSPNFKELYNIDKLSNIDLNINFDSGFLKFFGSKSSLKIYDRKKEVTNNNIIIKSKINIKAYALGIRIKQLNYTLTEKFNSNGLLSFQKFIENDGSYFTMEYK